LKPISARSTHVWIGSKGDLTAQKSDFRFTPESRLNSDIASCPKGANSGSRVQMPGSMDGLKLAAAIRGRWPPIKIVATSGLVKISRDDLPSGSR
jgi:hypothetical protein